jgi:hypothetical protein
VAEERRGRLRALAAEVPRIAGAVLGKHGFAEAQLVAQWPAIIGADIARSASPEKLTFGRGERANGTLHLRVAPAAALEIQHREPVLLERINAFFGYRAVARLALRQAPPVSSRRQMPPPARPLDAGERGWLEGRVAEVEDPELRAALKRLGEAVVGRSS